MAGIGVRGVLLDIAGVILQGRAALPGAVAALQRLSDARLPHRFVTNTTSKPKRAVLESLEAAGIAVDPDQIFAPAAAAVQWLAANGHSPHLLVAAALEEDFSNCARGLPKAVVVGDAGPEFTYDRLNAAFRSIASGAPFLALATNRVFTDASGQLALDAGAFVKALEYASGVAPVVLGKPAPAFFEAAASSMDTGMDQTAMIGDDAEFDVAGALAAGVGTAILVQTGKYRPGDEARVTPSPTATVPDIGAAVDRVLSLAG